jgi:hypothetical protein
MNKIILLLLFFSLPAIAEVSDKMNSQADLYFSGFLSGCLLALLIRWSKWTNLIAWPLVALFFYFAYETFADPFIGPVIIQEQGIAYIFASYGLGVFALIGVIYGNYLSLKANNRKA